MSTVVSMNEEVRRMEHPRGYFEGKGDYFLSKKACPVTLRSALQEVK